MRYFGFVIVKCGKVGHGSHRIVGNGKNECEAVHGDVKALYAGIRAWRAYCFENKNENLLPAAKSKRA